MTPPQAPIARRVNAERLALFGWSRAILLQFAHPLVAAAVADHSGFRAGPFAAVARLHHTLRAMLAITFGDAEARGRSLAGIRAIHRRIHGRLPGAVGPFPASTPYSAEDPDLVLWVHATLLESLPMVHGLLVESLSDRDHDAYCDEAADVALALGARPADVPRTSRQLRRYLDAMYASGQIVVSPQARELAAALLAPPLAALVAPARWINRTIAVGLLPAPVRGDYGFAWSDRHARRMRVAVRLVRTARHALPRVITQWPDSRRDPHGASAGA